MSDDGFLRYRPRCRLLGGRRVLPVALRPSLVPAYVSYVSGNTLASHSMGGRASSVLLSVVFVLGFSTIFVALGATATALSRLLFAYRYEASIVGGAVVVLFGVFMTGIVRLPPLERDMRFHGAIPGGRPAGAYLLGVAFGFGWTPCIGPILGAILTVSAVSSTASIGVTLLSAYALGLGVPFLASALFADGLMRRLKVVRGLGQALHLGAGGVMIAMGVAMMTRAMTTFSFWLLETFPALSSIG
jgi:cytochrome c-type biogenesis protein